MIKTPAMGRHFLCVVTPHYGMPSFLLLCLLGVQFNEQRLKGRLTFLCNFPEIYLLLHVYQFFV